MRNSLLVVNMARLLTALALLLAVTITLASFASTAAARSVRLPGNGMTADGASGAVDTAGGAITAESAPSFAQRSAGDEQSRRKLQTSRSDCDDAIRLNCDENQFLFFKWAKSAKAKKECENHRAEILAGCKKWGY
ncbi:unnamed protein product, partial [Closterium sp. Yama58-4]